MPATTKDKATAKSTVKVPAKAGDKTEQAKASKPKASYFGGLGKSEELANFLEAHTPPVRRNTWSSKVAFMLVAQGEDATEATIAKAWAESGEPFPGKGGVYHDGDEDHAQKTPLQSCVFGTRRALRSLHNAGLIEVKEDKIVFRTGLKKFVGQVKMDGTRTARKVRVRRPAKSEGNNKSASTSRGRASRVSTTA